jgi:hypothetical protein
VRRVFFVIFEGFDVSRLMKFKHYISNFESLSQPGFPMVALANIHHGNIEPGVSTVLGAPLHREEPVRKEALKAMI